MKVQTECLPVDPIHHIGVCAGRPIIRDDRGYRGCIQSVWGWLKMQESMELLACGSIFLRMT